ncbi:MAG TPA: FAD-dependent oxidoreductase, partial [Armatimonadaceae bacterium]|nr:FAD-dependent oxidoreductase [Armatimonadaceae bacterium]
SAVAAARYGTAGKIGLQFRRRFWEEEDRIYGGITRTDPPCLQIWYPSHGFFAPKGVLVGYYTFDDMARALGEASPGEREERALEHGARVHGKRYREEFECGYSVAWERVPYSLGAWGQGDVPELREPDGRLFFAGADLTALNGWMAGAFESARGAARAVHERVQIERKPEGGVT